MPLVRKDEGKHVKVFNDTVQIKIPSSRSPNLLSLVKVSVPPGSFLPAVSHEKEEEVYYVLRGRLSVVLGREEAVLESGDLMHVPPGTPHAYRNNTSQPVEFLSWTIGGPTDLFFEEMSEQVKALPQDAPAMASLLNKYGVTMIA